MPDAPMTRAPMPSPPPTSPRAADAAPPAEIVVLFAGGGTGGHLFPNLAVAHQVEAIAGGRCRFAFLCSNRPIDAAILSRAGVAYTPVPAAAPSPRPLALLRFLRGWGPSVRAGREAIRSARAEGGRVVMVASGGFVAAPLAQAARVERCPVIMLNLDAVPGRANRWIARHATRIFTTATPSSGAPRPSGRAAPWEPIPPIVRPGALASMPAPECRRSFKLDPDRPTLLVTGGSQGASSLNRFLIEFVRARPEVLRGWQVIHQTGGQGEAGALELDAVQRAYEDAGVPAHVTPFLDRMGEAWGAADLCVCRAGAGNVAEAWASRTPCLFMPYPFHKDGHQRANALPLVEKGAAVLARDAVEPRANMEEAGAALAELLGSDGVRGRLREALAALGPCDGSRRVADAVRELAPRA